MKDITTTKKWILCSEMALHDWELKYNSCQIRSSPLHIYLAYLSCIPSFSLVNNTEEVGPLLTVNITKPNTNKWHLKDLEPVSRYRFYLFYCTQTGCGPATSEEYITIPEARKYQGIALRDWDFIMDPGLYIPWYGWPSHLFLVIHPCQRMLISPLVPPCFSYAHLCASLLLNNIIAVQEQAHSSLSRKTKCLSIWGKGKRFRKGEEIMCHLQKGK